MSKLAITPVVIAIEWVVYRKAASTKVLMSIAVLMVGLALCSVTDTQVTSNTTGIMAAVASVLVAALYQARRLPPPSPAPHVRARSRAASAPSSLPPVPRLPLPPRRLLSLTPAPPPPLLASAARQIWAGTKQKELGLNGMQLLQQVSPMSVVLLLVLVPLTEPVGFVKAGAGTILGYEFTPVATGWILVSSLLGLVVTLTTFLFIGATSSLTYNVVGHLKTLLIVAAGVFIFGEDMSLKKGAGLATALGGIIWYTQIKMEEARKPSPSDSKG